MRALTVLILSDPHWIDKIRLQWSDKGGVLIRSTIGLPAVKAVNFGAGWLDHMKVRRSADSRLHAGCTVRQSVGY
jgi:hypothetical protein